MKIKQHEAETKKSALARAMARGPNETLSEIASAYDLKLGTLKGWLKEAARERRQTQPGSKAAVHYTAAEQLDALLKTAAMDDVERAAWCRQHGLFVHHLAAWKQSFSTSRGSESEALKASQEALKRTQIELRRKEKALAEAAALLVLQKKFQSLFLDEAV
jgi:transposase-like protein